MAANRNAVRAGAFIVLSAGASLALLLAVSGPGLFEAKRSYVVMFPFDADVQGIKAGDDVRLAGIRVGSVAEVALRDEQASERGATTQPSRARVAVTIRIPEKYVLREGATASLGGGLVGSATLNIDSLGVGAPLSALGEIQGSGSPLSRLFALGPKLEGLVGQVQTSSLPKVEQALSEYQQLAADVRRDVLPRANDAIGVARQAIQNIADAIPGVITRYNGVADALRVAATNIGDFIGPGDGTATKDFKATMGSVRAIAARVETDLPVISGKLQSVLTRADDALANLQGSFDDLKATIANARDLTGGAKALLNDNRSRIDRILISLEGTMANAKLFTAEVLRRPSRLLWRDDAVTQNNIEVYHSTREFAEGAAELNDTVMLLRDTLKDPRISDSDLKRRLEQIEASFQRFDRVQDKLYRSVTP